MKNQIIDFLRDKKILILGFGREGKSSLDFIRRELPQAEVAVADQQDIVVENTTMAKISCSGANGGNDVKSTTFLYKNTLKNHSFYANMKAVEMTKIKT